MTCHLSTASLRAAYQSLKPSPRLKSSRPSSLKYSDISNVSLAPPPYYIKIDDIFAFFFSMSTNQYISSQKLFLCDGVQTKLFS